MLRAGKPKKRKDYGSDGSKDGSKEPEPNGGPPSGKKPVKGVGLGTLFRYATGTDWLLMFVGTVASVVHGAGWPILSIVFGGM